MNLFDEVAADYDSVGVDFFTPMGAALAAAAAIRPGEHVLDVGCGRGAVLFPAAAAAGAGGRVTGLDSAPAMVALTATAAAGLPQVEVTVGDAQAPDFPDASLDVVTAGLLLFFLPDPAAALRAYRKLLRPGGRLAFSSFAANDPRHRRAMQAISRRADNPPPPPAQDGIFQSADTLHAATGAAGFDRTVITPYTVRSDFRDTAHFLDWVGSHGGRAALRHVPEARRPQLIEDLAEIFPEPPSITTTIHLVVSSVEG